MARTREARTKLAYQRTILDLARLRSSLVIDSTLSLQEVKDILPAIDLLVTRLAEFRDRK